MKMRGQALNVNDSSFIQTINLDAPSGEVDVIMKREPNKVYTYKPTNKGLSAIMSASKNGKSMGEAYNKHLRGRELHRLIYNG